MTLSHSQLELELERLEAELSDWATQVRRREIYQAQLRNHVVPLLDGAADADRDYVRTRILTMLEAEGHTRTDVLAFLPELE